MFTWALRRPVPMARDLAQARMPRHMIGMEETPGLKIPSLFLHSPNDTDNLYAQQVVFRRSLYLIKRVYIDRIFDGQLNGVPFVRYGRTNVYYRIRQFRQWQRI